MDLNVENKCGCVASGFNNFFSIKCEVFIYKNHNWSQIPEKINPAYININNKSFYALLICKVLPSECSVTGMDGYIVTDISGRFVACRRLGIFWQLRNAELFAVNYAKDIENALAKRKGTKSVQEQKKETYLLGK